MPEKLTDKRRVLISPLTWGLGHASRLLPVIKALLDEGHHCFIAGETPAIDIIREAFPGLHYIQTKGFKASLSGSNHQLLKLICQLPAFMYSIFRDQKIARSLADEHSIDLIISDNRYGFRTHKVSSILITHQTAPETGRLMSWTKPFVHLALRWLIGRFNACWIPDWDSSPSISGNLSQRKLNPSTFYTGLLSRLSILSEGTNKDLTGIIPDILVILSGPEPQRSQLENLIIKRFDDSHLNIVILQGLPGETMQLTKRGPFTFLSHCSASTYHQLLAQSKQIICRSGYSTLMDLFFINKNALLIPTPGQYEQLYLAEHMHEAFNFTVVNQNTILTSPHLNHTPSGKIHAFTHPQTFLLPPLP